MKPLGPVHGDQGGFTLVELLVTMAVLGLVLAAVFGVYMTGTTIGLTGENKAEAQQAARAAALMEEDVRLLGLGCPSAGCPPPAVAPLAGCPPPAQGQIICATPTAAAFWADLTNTSTTLTLNVNVGDTVLNVTAPGGFAVGDTVYLNNGTQFARHTVAAISNNNKTITVNPAIACPPPAPGTACTAPAPLAFPQGAQVGRARLIIYSWNAVTQTLSKDPGDGTGLQPLATGIQAFQLTYFDTSESQILPPINLANIRRIGITLTAQSAAALNRGTFTINSSVRPRNL